jgi:hypothetical protein
LEKGTVIGFMKAVEQEDYERALDYLDTRQPPKHARVLRRQEGKMRSRCRKISGGISQKWLRVIKGMIPLFFLSLTATVGFAEEISYDYNHGLGTLEMFSQSPAQSLRLTLPMVVPGSIKPGWGAHVHTTWTNVWAKGSEFLLDYEMLDTVLSVTYGFDTRLGLAVGFNNRNYFGGEMDNFIHEFHDLFGISQDGRDEVPKNRKVIQLFDTQTGRTAVELSAHDLNNNSINLLLNYNISHGTQIWPSVNVYGVASYALNSAEVFKEDHQVDYGFGLGFAKQWSKRWYTYAAVGFSIFDDREMRELAANVKPVKFEDKQLTGMFSLSWHYTPTFAVLAQYLYSGAAVKNINELDESSHEVQLGFKWDTRSIGMIEFALIENVFTFDNSPDFGLHMGWSYVF